MATQNRILIDRVVVVMADPSARELDRLEGGYAFGQRRPDCLLEQAVVDVKIQAIGIVLIRRGHSAYEAGALGPEIDARRIDGEWRPFDRCLAIEDEDAALARAHRQLDPRHGSNAMAVKAGAVDQIAAGKPPGLGQLAADGEAASHPWEAE